VNFLEELFTKRKGAPLKEKKSTKKVKGDRKEDNVNMLRNDGLTKDILNRLGMGN
jgi:hypothetical protein